MPISVQCTDSANRQLSALSGRLDALEGVVAPAEVAAAPVGELLCVECDFGVSG